MKSQSAGVLKLPPPALRVSLHLLYSWKTPLRAKHEKTASISHAAPQNAGEVTHLFMCALLLLRRPTSSHLVNAVSAASK